MKEIFIIKETLTDKISYYHLLAFLVMLPFDRFYSEVVLISLLIHSLIHLKKEKLFSLGMPFVMLVSIYLLTIICTIYSADKEQAFKDMEKQLAIFLFPFIFSVITLTIQKYKLRLLKGFAISCIATVIYLYIDALQIIQYNRLPLVSLLSPGFTNHNFSAAIGLHATYFSMYIAVSLTAFLYFFFVSFKIYQRIFYAGGIIILAAAIVQLSSRSVFIAAFLIINLLVPLFLLKGAARKKYMLISLFLSGIIIFSVIRIDAFKNRFVTELRKDLTQPDSHLDLQESRAARWLCAWQLIRKSPVIGYGTGSEGKLLKEKYFENRLYISYLNELNAHNEYLSFFLKSGIVGLILYLYILATGFINAWQKKDIFFFGFLIIVSIVSFSENILDTNKGIFFFSFFLSLFAWPIGEYKPFLHLNKTHKKINPAANEAVLNIEHKVQECDASAATD